MELFITRAETADLFRAIWENTVSLLSGILGLIITGIGLFWPEVPAKGLWQFFGLTALFLSLILAWRDGYRELRMLQERLKSPELGGDIGLTYVTDVAGQDTLIFVDFHIVNPLGPPSAVLNWSMTVELADARILTGEIGLLSGGDILARVPEGQLTFPYVNYAPHKMMHPIPAGGISAGWFWSTFRGIHVGELYRDKPASVVVSFSDAVAGKPHHLKRRLNPDSYIPGLFTQIKESK